MTQTHWHDQIKVYDKRRDLVIPGNREATVRYAVEHFIGCANEAIEARGAFCVALSGGSTPKAIFQALAEEQNINRIDWAKVKIFWSDERTVSAEHEDSNYRMAMLAGFDRIPVPREQIFRMEAELDVKAGAESYEQLLQRELSDGAFDLMTLGMGDDGHTASLFPETAALKEESRWVAANEVPQKSCWRMTFTYPCINASRNIAVYVIGEGKAEMLEKVLEEPYLPDLLPSQAVGTEDHKALWVCDETAAAKLLE